MKASYLAGACVAACSLICGGPVTTSVAAPAGGAIDYVDSQAGKPVVMLKNGAGYSPYLIYGVQIRLDQMPGVYDQGNAAWDGTGSGTNGIDYAFNRAKFVGFNTVVVPVYWNKIESTDASGNKVYDFSYVQKIIDRADKYGLYVQFTWNGSDSCGYMSAPSYVSSDPATYPLNKNHTQFLDLSNQKLIDAESGALVSLMNYVAAHDANHRVIMVEIESEPDGCGPTGSLLKWGDMANMLDTMFAGGQFDAVNRMVNTLADAVHKSNWKGLTRVNIGTAYRSIDCVNYRAALASGVDLFGVDHYSSSLTENYNALGLLAPPGLLAKISPAPANDPLSSITPGTRARYAANVIYQPEGGGQYADLISLILQNFAEGGGSLIYELRTTQSWQSNGVWQPTYDLGVYRRTNTENDGTGNWTERDGTLTTVPYDINGGEPGLENNTEALRTFNTTIYKADQKIAAAVPGTCAAFNLGCTLGSVGKTQTLNVGSTSVTYKSWSNSPAFAIKDTNGDLILMNFADGNNFEIDPSFHHGAKASVGYYDANDIWHEQYTRPFNGNELLAFHGEVFRIAPTP